MLTERQAALVVRQLLRGLNYMHKTLNIAHRDIKAENVLFKSADISDMTIKLCDFGFATSFVEENPKSLQKIVGSPYYIAPEVLLASSYDYRCDLWSLGILLYFMLSHTFPFKGLTNDEIFHSIKREKLKFDGIIWDGISETAKDFIAKLLTKSPVIRMTAVDALEHPYLHKVSNSSGNPKQNKKIIS